MPMFHCAWAERPSLLIDAESRTHAHDLAVENADGAGEPDLITAIPHGAIVLELGEEESEPGMFAWSLYTGCEATDQLFDVLEENADKLVPGEGDAPELADLTICGEEANEPGGHAVTCTLIPDHPGNHEGLGSDGGVVEW